MSRREPAPVAVFVTGASGYVGGLVVEALANKARVVAADVRPPAKRVEGVEYVFADVREPSMREAIVAARPEVVVHLASIVSPGKGLGHDVAYAVDVLGTRNVLDACVAAAVKKIVVTSSGAAYGYHPDNPQWLEEDHPLRGNDEFPYARHKRLVEEMLAEYRVRHPELKQLVFRPGTILGRKVKNQITDLFDKPVLLGVAGSASPFVFVWDQDVVACIVQGALGPKAGVYNLAGDGTLSMAEIARLQKKLYLPVPAALLRGALRVLKAVGLTQYGPEQVLFLQHRPVLSNARLKRDFGYVPARTSAEVFQLFLEGRKGSA